MQILIEIIMLLMGVGIIYFGITQKKRLHYLLQSGVKTPATVTEIVEKQSDPYNKKYYNGVDMNIMYYPVITYNTPENELITRQYNYGTNPSKYKEGDIIEILYDPENYESFMINDGSTNLMPSLIIFFGGLFIVAAIVISFFKLPIH